MSDTIPSSARSALREAAPHEAGMEFDALIAEKVMGWVWKLDQDSFGWGGKSEVYRVICDPKMWGDDSPLLGLTTGTEPMRLDRPYHGQRPPKYSTDIAAAWLVVEKLRADGWGLSLHYEGEKSNQWVADYVRLDDQSEYTGEELGPTAPLAICRAALLASSPTGGTTE